MSLELNLRKVKEEKNEENIELEMTKKTFVGCIEMLLEESKEENFNLGDMLVETDRAIEEHKKDNIGIRKRLHEAMRKLSIVDEELIDKEEE